MSKRERKRKYRGEYINGNGTVYRGDFLEASLKGGRLEDILEETLQADEDDKIIKKEAKKIKEFIDTTSGEKNRLERWYHLGKILQFTDRLELKGVSARKEAFRRLKKDLRVDTKRNPSLEKLTRYFEHMYILAKIPVKLVFYEGMTWSRWFDILEYKTIVKDKKILRQTVEKCCKNNWTADELRKELQSLNKMIKGKVDE